MAQSTDYTELYIKNMVCPRCIAAVDSFLKANRLKVLSVELGKASVEGSLTKQQKDAVAQGLHQLGFEVLDDKKTKIVEQIKNIVIDFVHYQEENMSENLSSYIVARLNMDYSSLTKIFSQSEKTTIEKYFIAQKIEKVKELLSYDEMTLSEIAFKLNYSSSAYLSAQFKQVTGMTPSQYKNLKDKNRKFLSDI